MRRDADRTHARTAAAVRDAERLVQVQVADVGADVARPREPHHARSCSRRRGTPGRRAACTISQTSPIVSSNTPCVDGYVTMIAPSFVPVLPSPSPRRSAMSMLPARVGLHDDDLHARHHRARRVRPVRRLRNEADVAVPLAARLVVRRITSSPAYSPCDPAFGCSDTAAKPVISASAASSRSKRSGSPSVCSTGANGMQLPRSPATSPGTSRPSR